MSSIGTPIVTGGGVRSWGLDRIDQINLPLNTYYNPGADGSNVHSKTHAWSDK